MDLYSQLLLHFYRQVTARHSQRFVLIRTLQTSICRLQEHLRRQERQLLLDPFSDFDEPSHCLRRDNESCFLRASELRWGCTWLFSSKSFEKALFFGILYYLAYHQNSLSFKQLSEEFRKQVASCQFSEGTVNMLQSQWGRIQWLYQERKVLNWGRVLCNSVRRMPRDLNLVLNRLFYKSATEGSHDAVISRIAVTFNVRVTSLQLEGRQILKSAKYGSGMGQFCISMICEVGRYTISSHCPSLSESDIARRYFTCQLGLGLGNLQNLYELGTSKLSELSFFREGSSNELRVTQLLSRK